MFLASFVHKLWGMGRCFEGKISKHIHAQFSDDRLPDVSELSATEKKLKG